MEEINKLVQKHKIIKEQLELLNNQLEAVKAEIKLHMTSEELEKYEDPEGNVITYKIYTRSSINKDKLIEIYGEEAFDKVKKTTEFEALRITPKEVIENLKKRSDKNEK